MALWILAGVVAAVAVVVGSVFLAGWLADRDIVRQDILRRELRRQVDLPGSPSMFDPPPQPARPAPAQLVAEPVPEPTNRLLVPPPEVELNGVMVTLHEWARLKAGDARTVFQEIVADFYTALLTDPRVSSYFPGREGITTLRAHFANAFIVLARDGLYLSTANELAVVHRNIRNGAGEPITGEVYDIVIGHLVHTLTEIKYGVPDTPECLGRLGTMVELAKPLIVAA